MAIKPFPSKLHTMQLLNCNRLIRSAWVISKLAAVHRILLHRKGVHAIKHVKRIKNNERMAKGDRTQKLMVIFKTLHI